MELRPRYIEPIQATYRTSQTIQAPVEQGEELGKKPNIEQEDECVEYSYSPYQIEGFPIAHDLVGPEVIAEINVKGGNEEDYPWTVYEEKLCNSLVSVFGEELLYRLDGQEGRHGASGSGFSFVVTMNWTGVACAASWQV